MIHNLSKKSSVANHFIADIRDVEKQKDPVRFRNNLSKIGEILAYEISKTLSYSPNDIETPLGIAQVALNADTIVIATILRAGLPMHQGLLNYFPAAENAFVSAHRQHHKDGSFEINMQSMTCPPLKDKILIICDPMIATGASMEKAIEALCENHAPKKIYIASIIASQDGIDHISRLFPKVDVFVGAIDDELTARAYIVPGLGDAGDLAFGSKMQS